VFRTMSRKRLIRTANGIYHVTSRVNRKEPFPLPKKECWPIFKSLLGEIDEKFGVAIHAFVLMSNHYHLLISTPLSNIDSAMKVFNQESTRLINTRSGLENHLFGDRYHRSLIDSCYGAAHVLKYIYRNPAKAKMVDLVEEYPYSTIHGFTDKKRFPFLKSIRGLEIDRAYGGVRGVLNWLNIPLTSEQHSLVRKAVRRQTFKFPTSKRYKRIENELPEPPW